MKKERIIQDIVHSHCELSLTEDQASAIWEQSRAELKQMNANVIMDQMESDGPTAEMAENILLEIILSTPAFKNTQLNAMSFQP